VPAVHVHRHARHALRRRRSVEHRGAHAAWITGEQWKVDAFRAYDEKRGPDLYRVAYARSFGVADPATVTGQRRQVGKVTELSLQYQGSVGAWIKMAANYGVAPADVVEVVRLAVPEEAWLATAMAFPHAPDKHGLPQNEWVAIKLIVKGWREAHSRLVQGWWDLQDAAIEAVANPGAVVPVLDGKVRYVFSRGFLWCSLPSGRVLAYFNPHVVTSTPATSRHPTARASSSTTCGKASAKSCWRTAACWFASPAAASTTRATRARRNAGRR
jgi:DNA polymerase